MNQASQVAAVDANSIVVAVSNNPSVILFDSDKFDAFYAKLKADVDDVPVDLTTRKGRDAIASVAAKVRSEKARIDKDRLRLTKEWRDMTAQVNGAWNGIKDQLDTLAVEARKPLTDWEEAENTRLATCRETIARIKGAALVTIMDTAATVRERGTEIWSTKIDADVFGDLVAEAMAAKEQTVTTLKEALARLEREEEEREELAKLRAEAAEREKVEAERLAKAEQEAAEAAEIKREKEAIAAAEKAEAERIERAKEEAAQRVRDEANRVAEIAEGKRRYARSIIEHIQEVGLGMIGGQRYAYGVLLHELTDKIVIDDDLGDLQDEVRAIRDATLASLQAAMERSAERAARQEKEEQDRLALKEQAKRDADQKHRTSVKTAIKQALMTCGADEETARKIVLALQAGEIPNTTLRF